jgi:hypothetical protein
VYLRQLPIQLSYFSRQSAVFCMGGFVRALPFVQWAAVWRQVLQIA